MRRVVLHALADGLAPADVYARISDFRRYPEHSDTFREVHVEPPLSTAPRSRVDRRVPGAA